MNKQFRTCFFGYNINHVDSVVTEKVQQHQQKLNSLTAEINSLTEKNKRYEQEIESFQAMKRHHQGKIHVLENVQEQTADIKHGLLEEARSRAEDLLKKSQDRVKSQHLRLSVIEEEIQQAKQVLAELLTGVENAFKTVKIPGRDLIEKPVQEDEFDAPLNNFENTEAITKNRYDCSAIDLEKSSYIIGKLAGKDLLDDDGNIIIKKGDTITAETMEKAESAGKMTDLIVYLTLPVFQ